MMESFVCIFFYISSFSYFSMLVLKHFISIFYNFRFYPFKIILQGSGIMELDHIANNENPENASVMK